ncbi:MAG: glucose-1-phosphate thymidylyltransferase RfbA [Clostridia bacterium]|jgi:glucose-1-phosphate thymidylyltransferase
MKGIILAGGAATRLYPITKSVSKQILPIYDKPMIYYPLSVLMLAGIRDILIISTPRDIDTFIELLGDGKDIGLNLQYAIQEQPRGIADAFIIGEKFIGRDRVALILGDNIFFGYGFSERLKNIMKRRTGATIFVYHVSNPRDFGIVEFDENDNVISIEEKPVNPKSNYAITGFYFYDNDVIEIAKKLKPSARGEIEISAINSEYLKRGKLKVELFGRGMAWIDSGSCKGLLEAANFVEAIQVRQGLYVSCIEEIAFRMGFITKEQLLRLAEPLMKTDYGQYLANIATVKKLGHYMEDINE